MNYKQKKVISIGIVSDLTNLSIRQIRYYESRGLLSPERSNGGTRKYSFEDIEKLADIFAQMKRGESTYDIRKKENSKDNNVLGKNKLIKDQVHAFFNRQGSIGET